MDLKYLKTFRTIVGEGSFSKAAEALNYTQSTITFHVAQLEKDVGVQLFEKAGRTMILTKAGEALIPYVDEVLAAERKLRNFQTDISALRGTLSVAAPETLLAFAVPPLLREFHLRAPGVKLVLTSMNSRRVREALREDKVDVGIFYEQPGEEISLEIRPFQAYRLHFFASPRIGLMHPELIRHGAELTELARIVQPMPGAIREQFDRYLREHDITLGNSIEIRSTQTIKNLAKNDVGICFLPDFVVSEEVERGELVRLAADEVDEGIAARYGWHKNKWKSPAMELFLRILEEHAGK